MKFSVQASRRLRAASWLALFGTVLAGGCSKKPAAPPIPSPTRFVVFSSDRGRTAGNLRNYFATLDGGGASQLALGGAASVLEEHPSISQDGRVVAYESSPGVGGSHDVFLFSRSTNGRVGFTDINSALDETDPCISLDGKRLAFVRDSAGTRHVRLFDLTNGLFIPLPGLETSGFSDWEPALDAQGRGMVFTSNRNGTSDVFLYQITTHTLADLPALRSAGGDQEASLSGDGRYILFASNRTGGQGDFDLYLFDLNNLILVSLPGNANTGFVERDPTISFDGSNIIFVSNRATGMGGMDLWSLNRVGAVLTQVTGLSSLGDDLEPTMVWP